MYRWESDDPNYKNDVNLLDEYENPPENYEPQHPDLSVPLAYLMNPDLFDSEEYEYEFEPSGSLISGSIKSMAGIKARDGSVEDQRNKLKGEIKTLATEIHGKIIKLKDMLVTLLKLGGDKNVVAEVEKEVVAENKQMEEEIKAVKPQNGKKPDAKGPNADAKGTKNKDGKKPDAKGPNADATGVKDPKKDPGKVKNQSAEEIAAAKEAKEKEKNDKEAAAAAEKERLAKEAKEAKEKEKNDKKAPDDGAKKKAKFQPLNKE